MSRTTDRLDRIEAAVRRAETTMARIEDALNPATPGGLSVAAAEAKAARSAAEATLAGMHASAETAHGDAAGLKTDLGWVTERIKSLSAVMTVASKGLPQQTVMTPAASPVPAATPSAAGSAGTSGAPVVPKARKS